MTDTPDLPPIIAAALEWLPTPVRADYAGAAFLKLQTLAGDLHHADQVRAVASHVRTLYRKERRSSALDPSAHDRPSLDPAGEDELAETLAALAPTDRGIIAMILAGHGRTETACALSISPATLCRRLQRIRLAWRK
jgi:hypothetical protein